MIRPIRHLLPLERVRVSETAGREFNWAFCHMSPGKLAVRRSGSEALQLELLSLEEYEVVVIE